MDLTDTNLSSAQALKLGKELYDLFGGKVPPSAPEYGHICQAVGSTAFFRSMELAKEMEK